MMTALLGWSPTSFGSTSLIPRRVNTTQREFTIQNGWSTPTKDIHHSKREVIDFKNLYKDAYFNFYYTLVFVEYLGLKVIKEL